VAVVQFANQPDAMFILVGCGIKLRLRPRQASGGCVYTFLISSKGDQMDMIHRTPTDEVLSFFVLIRHLSTNFKVVNAIHEFRGMVLIGVGKMLRLYDLGKRKLLRKCENKVSFLFWSVVQLTPRLKWVELTRKL
jgi:splicing factor 3B subunit 3